MINATSIARGELSSRIARGTPSNIRNRSNSPIPWASDGSVSIAPLDGSVIGR